MRPSTQFCNDGSKDAPKLRVFMNLDTVNDLREDSVLPKLETVPLFERLAADGFEGAQLTTDAPAPPRSLLPYCGLDRVNTPADADVVASKHAARGDLCITVHAGWGMEDDDDVFRLVEAILARTAFLHGRIASPGCMQVSIDSDLSRRPRQAYGLVDDLQHFREMWTRAMHGFLRTASEGAVLIFAPELLSKTYYYARMFPDSLGGLVEESDRYAQALLLKDLAKVCFEEAKRL